MLGGLFNWAWDRQRVPAVPTRALAQAVFAVRQGKRYRANVNLSWGEQLVASNEMVQAKLIEAGFAEVTVTGTGAVRKAEALWSGPDKSGEIDPHLSDVTEIA